MPTKLTRAKSAEKATQQETIEALLDRSKRDAVPIRKTFVQQGQGKVRDPGPLATLVFRHDERALDLYLLAHAVASSDPWDVTLSAAVWARAIGLGESKSSTAAVSKTFRRLDDLSLVARSRDGSRSRVTLLDEAGHGDPYTHPAKARHKYLKLPHAYWTDDWHRRLDLPAKAVLLIALSLDDGFILPVEKATDWYSMSPDTVQRGLSALHDFGALDYEVVTKKAPLAPAGITQERHHTLQAPFGPLRAPLATVTEITAKAT